MNQVFKVIFNQVLGRHVVVSEIASSIQRGACKAVVATASAAVLFLGGTAFAANPTNPVEGDVLNIGNSTENKNTVPQYSAAIGRSNEILDGINNSFAVGNGNTVGYHYTGYIPSDGSRQPYYGHNSAAIGENNQVLGDASIAVGLGSTAKGQYSFAGGGTVKKTVTTTVDDGNGDTIEQQDEVTVGSQALGDYSFAFGRAVTAGKENSIGSSYRNGYAAAFGDQTVASGNGSFAAGSLTVASADYSIAFGRNTEASMRYAVAVGEGSKASGTGSFAGGSTYNYGTYLEPDNVGSTAAGNGSFAFGRAVKAGLPYVDYSNMGSNYATAFGDRTEAQGEGSFAVGIGAVASGLGSVAAGITESEFVRSMPSSLLLRSYKTEASGRGAVAFGRGTTSSGQYAFAFGDAAEALGDYSFAGGGHKYQGTAGTNSSGWYTERNEQAAVYDYDISAYVYTTPTQALGNYSFAFGEGVTAGTLDTIEETEKGKVYRYGSMHDVAFGQKTTANGGHSFAAGSNTTASGAGSFAVGENSVASGRGAVAMGTYGQNYWSDGPVAEGDGSVAMGQGTHAKGTGSVAMGQGTHAKGTGSVAFGNKTTAAGEGSVAFGYGGTYNSSYVSSDGFDPPRDKITLSDGNRTGAYGAYSATFGYNTYAQGDRSVAMGSATKAIGDNSLAFGLDTYAVGKDSTAFGNGSVAYGNRSVAFGSLTTAGDKDATDPMNHGNDSLAFGLRTTASGSRSTAFGSDTKAIGEGSLAYGLRTTATGPRSTASGSGTYASADLAIASGNMTRALGQASEASGSYTAAYGQNAKSFGEYTHAIGKNSTAFGHYTTAGKRLQTDEEKALGIYTMVDPYTGEQTKVTKVNAKQYASMLTDASGNVVTDNDPGHVVDSVDRNYIIYHAKRGKDTSLYAIRVPIKDADGNPTGDYAIREVYQEEGDNTWYIRSEAEQAQLETAAGGKKTLLVNYDGVFLTDDSVKADNAVAFGNDTEASAENALAFGDATLASNKRATAFGNHTVATGDSATSFGDTTLASGRNATAFGESTVGTMQNTTAFGQESAALAKNATAFGVRTKALGQASTTWGDESIAPGKYATAFGEDSEAFSQDSAAWGSKTVAGIDKTDTKYTEYKEQLAALREKENQLKLLKKNGVTADILDSEGNVETKGSISLEAEIRADEAALTAKYADLKNLGKAATAFGENTNAIGTGSTAWGSKSVATGKYSTAFGESSKAYGQNSIAGLGGTTGTADINATGAISIGKGSVAQEANNIALGQKAKATGTNTIAIGVVDENGKGSTAKGANSIAIGTANTVNGTNSIAIGTGHTVSGNNSGAFGDPNTVNANDSYVVGNNSTIDTGADGSFVIGNDASATVEKSVALGSESHAYRNKANGGAGAGYDVTTGTNYAGEGKDSATWVSTLGAVSVGGTANDSDAEIGTAATATRQITGVAAGTADTDAVNVAQLKLLAGNISGGGATYTAEQTTVEGSTTFTINQENSDNAYSMTIKAGDNVTITKDGDTNVAVINAGDTTYTYNNTTEEAKQKDKSVVQQTTVIQNNPDGTTQNVATFTDTNTTYTTNVTNEGLKEGQVSKLTITNDVTGDTTEFVDTNTNTSVVDDGKGYVKVDKTKDATETAGPEYTVSLDTDALKGDIDTNTTYKFETEKTEDTSTTNVVSTTTVNSSTDGTNYTPTGETITDTDTKITNVTVKAGDKVDGNTTYTVTLNDNGDNKEGSSSLTATFDVQDNDTTYSYTDTTETAKADNPAVVNQITVTENGPDGKPKEVAKFTDTDTDTTYTVDIVREKEGTVAATTTITDSNGTQVGQFTDTHNGLKNDENTVTYNDDGEGSVTITDQDGNTTTINGIKNSGGGQKYGGDTGDVITKNAKEQVNVVGGITDESKLTTEDNIGVVSDGKDNLKVRLAKDVKGVDTVQVNNNVTVGSGGNTTTINSEGVKISNGPTITRTNVDMNNQQIHNVAAGTADNDAVNVSQLRDMSANYDQKINHLNHRIGEVAQDANAGVAMALAAASLPQVYLPGKNMMAIAGGTYRGESGYAIGFSSISDDGKWIIKAHASGNSQGHYGAGIGAGYMW